MVSWKRADFQTAQSSAGVQRDRSSTSPMLPPRERPGKVGKHPMEGLKIRLASRPFARGPSDEQDDDEEPTPFEIAARTSLFKFRKLIMDMSTHYVPSSRRRPLQSRGIPSEIVELRCGINGTNAPYATLYARKITVRKNLNYVYFYDNPNDNYPLGIVLYHNVQLVKVSSQCRLCFRLFAHRFGKVIKKVFWVPSYKDVEAWTKIMYCWETPQTPHIEKNKR